MNYKCAGTLNQRVWTVWDVRRLPEAYEYHTGVMRLETREALFLIEEEEEEKV